MKADFISYINEHNIEGSQKANSYIRAIDLLDDVLRTKAIDTLVGYNSIYDIVSAEAISNLYDYVLEEQKKENGIFKDIEQSSYWRKGFFSAALQTYLEYLKQESKIKTNDMGIWIEKTKIKNFPHKEKDELGLGRALVSPRTDSRGGDIYKNMRFVKPGDIIIHLVDNKKITGVSIVKDSVVEVKDIQISAKDGLSYIINLQGYREINPPLRKELILNDKYKTILEEISTESEVFYTYSLTLRQGAYLTPCPPKLANLINSIYKEQSSEDLPYFDEDYSSLISTIQKETDLQNTQNVKASQVSKSTQLYFNLSSFNSACDNAGLIYSPQLLARFAASLATKPFVLLTGLSGSGKTKLAQAFAQWICASKEQYCIVPVGADWINRDPLLGYVNALDNRQYILPENGALELIIRANNDKKKPYFLVLDEMNLSHVERYFADFLSVMESKDKIKLHSANKNLNNNEEEDFKDAVEVPKDLSWPNNLFVVGTVNIDETTYMFSPKVLDRANVIEFRITSKELSNYFDKNNSQLDMKKLCEDDSDMGKGAKYGESFVTIANSNEAAKDVAELNDELKKFFEKLQEIGAEFGYRSASEIQILFKKLDEIDISYSSRAKEKIDIAIMQKLLPKLHGSRSKLVDVLTVLATFCYDKELDDKELEKVFQNPQYLDAKVKYPISLEKINRMYRNVIDNGFTSYAEA